MNGKRISQFASVLVGGILFASCGTTPASTPAATAPAAATTAATAITETVTAAVTAEATAEAAATSEAAATAEATAAATSEANSPSGAVPTGNGEAITFGLVLVGPINDGGWNQAVYEGAKYAEAKITGSKLVYIDKVNPADKPNVTIPQVVDELIAQGAKLVITNSAEFSDGTIESATAHPDVKFIHLTGDAVLKGTAPENMGNLMGRMEFGKMIAGCAAALQTESGKISYLGPLIDPETLRLTNSVYLGAKYCWETYRSKPASELAFDVTWIGYWFNLPGQTLDPTKVANDFINAGSDVILSGIDTTEALVEADKATKAGKKVYAIPYDFKEVCSQAPDACLGVPYFNWGPSLTKALASVQDGSFKQSWDWIGPDASDINNPDTSMIGFVEGAALTPENKATLDEFTKKLTSGEVDLYTGPLNWQDGSAFLAAGEKADDQKIWYAQQLLEGIKGQSTSK